MKQWLCSPLLRIRDIRERQAALTVLNDSGIGTNVRAGLKGMPDLERLVAAIHVAGVKVSEDHPEARAIYYENIMYNAAKIKKLCQCLDALVVANNLFRVWYQQFVQVQVCIIAWDTSFRKFFPNKNVLSKCHIWNGWCFMFTWLAFLGTPRL